MRREALVASALSLPALMSPSDEESWSPPRLTRPAMQLLLERRGALERNVRHLDLRFLRKRFPEDVHRGARARGAVAVARAALLLQERHGVPEVVSGRARMRGPDEGHEHGDRYPSEIGVHVVGCAVGERRRHRCDREGDVVDQQCVAVGRRARNLRRGDRPAGAGTVLDQHRLAERLAHALADQPRDDVGGAARRERHQDAHGLRGELLGGR